MSAQTSEIRKAARDAVVSMRKSAAAIEAFIAAWNRAYEDARRRAVEDGKE